MLLSLSREHHTMLHPGYRAFLMGINLTSIHVFLKKFWPGDAKAIIAIAFLLQAITYKQILYSGDSGTLCVYFGESETKVM